MQFYKFSYPTVGYWFGEVLLPCQVQIFKFENQLTFVNQIRESQLHIHDLFFFFRFISFELTFV